MEFRLCEYLILNRGRWVSEQELLREALEVRHDRITSIVRVHIAKIRNAMGEYRECLAAKKGVGYRFNDPTPQRDQRLPGGTH